MCIFISLFDPQLLIFLVGQFSWLYVLGWPKVSYLQKQEMIVNYVRHIILDTANMLPST
jgi:uncharacterized membrane protein